MSKLRERCLEFLAEFIILGIGVLFLVFFLPFVLPHILVKWASTENVIKEPTAKVEKSRGRCDAGWIEVHTGDSGEDYVCIRKQSPNCISKQVSKTDSVEVLRESEKVFCGTDFCTVRVYATGEENIVTVCRYRRD